MVTRFHLRAALTNCLDAQKKCRGDILSSDEIESTPTNTCPETILVAKGIPSRAEILAIGKIRVHYNQQKSGDVTQRMD